MTQRKYETDAKTTLSLIIGTAPCPAPPHPFTADELSRRYGEHGQVSQTRL